MYLVNYLNRNKTDDYFPMFEIIYTIEAFSIASSFVAGVWVIFLAWQCTRLPRLLRLRAILTILMDIVYISSRVMVMEHQYFGPSEYVVTSSLIFGSMMKQIFMGYMTSFLSIIALDRWVATKFWSWYERNANSTLLFLALQEVLIYPLPIVNSDLLVYGYTTSTHSICFFAVLLLIGSTLFVIVYQHNVRELLKMKQGAVINVYSVARTYQIQENVSILSSLKKIALPLSTVCIPPFVFFPIYKRVPPHIGYDGLRYFSASMYDLWLSFGSVVVILSVPYYFPKLLPIKASEMTITSVSSAVRMDAIHSHNGDTYFSLLSNDLQQGTTKLDGNKL